MDRLERAHDVFAAIDFAARRELFRAHGESRREVPEGQELPDEPLDAAWAVHVEGRLAAIHRHALHHPRQPEEMVAVEVGHEDAGDLHEAQLAQHELPLGAFAAVEQEDLRASLDGDRAHVPPRGRPRSGGAEEHDLHGRVPNAGGCLTALDFA